MSSISSFIDFIQKETGIVLTQDKTYLIESRLKLIVKEFDLKNFDHLYDEVVKISCNKKLKESVINAMTTNETLWFRDTYPYDFLKDTFFKEKLNDSAPINIWSSASSSGQEPYSISMILHELKAKPGYAGLVPRTKIKATDLSTEMLDKCKEGYYPNLALVRGLSEERKVKFFNDADKTGAQISDEIKKNVTFEQFNLLHFGSYSSLGKFDIIFCRNVLIYFEQDIKNKILEHMIKQLKPGGYLILGASESVNALKEQFNVIKVGAGSILQLK